MNTLHTISLLPARAQKATLKALIASLNQSIIGYGRAHIKSTTYEAQRPKGYLTERDDVPHIDRYDDERLGSKEVEEREEFMSNAGNEILIKPLEVFTTLSQIRTFLNMQLIHSDEFSPQYDAAYPLANSLAYNISRAPREDISSMEKMAQATGIPLTRLLKANQSNNDSSYKELVDAAPKILDLYDEIVKEFTRMSELSVSGKKILTITEDEDGNETADFINQGYTLNDDWFESAFASLPVHVQYKLGIKLNAILITASDRCVELMLQPARRGAKDAVGDIKMIDAARSDHYKWLSKFNDTHVDALDAVAERSYLPELPDENEQPIVSRPIEFKASNVAQAMNKQYSLEH